MHEPNGFYASAGTYARTLRLLRQCGRLCTNLTAFTLVRAPMHEPNGFYASAGAYAWTLLNFI